MFLRKGLGIGNGDNQKALTLDSGEFVNFIQTFGPLVSFYYNFGVGFMTF